VQTIASFHQQAALSEVNRPSILLDLATLALIFNVSPLGCLARALA